MVTIVNFTATTLSETVDCGGISSYPDLVALVPTTINVDWRIYFWTNGNLAYNSYGVGVPQSVSRRDVWTPVINGSQITLTNATSPNVNYNLICVRRAVPDVNADKNEVEIRNFTATSTSETVDCGINSPDMVAVVPSNNSGVDWRIYFWTNGNLAYNSYGVGVPQSTSTRATWNPIINSSSINLNGAVSVNVNYNLICVKKAVQ